SRRRHTRFSRDWSSDVCSSDLAYAKRPRVRRMGGAASSAEAQGVKGGSDIHRGVSVDAMGFASALPILRAEMILSFVMPGLVPGDRKSTRLNSSHVKISYAVFC